MAGPVRRVALVTGVGRRKGIGAHLALRLASDGFDVAFTYWGDYDRRMPWGDDSGAVAELTSRISGSGARCLGIESDLEDPSSPRAIFDEIEGRLGPVSLLAMSHCESVDSGIFDTSVDSFDRHYRVNVRASWLLIREMGARFDPELGGGRIIALTSDAIVGNLAYGATKAALDRVTISAARELGQLGITSNVINPGPIDTGWMDEELKEQLRAAAPLRRLGTAADVANLVSFLCSEQGGWINGQLLHSNGGLPPLLPTP